MRLRVAFASLLLVLTLSASASIKLMHVFSFDYGENPPTHSDPLVEVGDTVRWIVDSGIHTVTSAFGQADSFDSSFLSLGDTFDHMFNIPGVFNYYCQIHGIDLGGGQVAGMSGHVSVGAVVHPTGFSIFRGLLVSGGLAEVQNSDDQYLVVGRGIVINPQEAAIQVDFTASLALLSPKVLGVSIEDGSNAIGLSRVVSVLNVQTNQFEQFNQSQLTMTDKVTVVQFTGDLTRFINQTNGNIKVRIGYPALGPVNLIGYQGKFDRVAFLVS